MAGRIPDETIQMIRDRVSLVEVVSGYVNLKKTGRNYLGLCPFHGEKTPSFTVSEERGLFHCFGCGAGGTVYNFLMRVERVEFVEAVEQLAKRAGIEIPRREAQGPQADQREQWYRINELAAAFFRATLRGPLGADARQYLARRGLKEELVERYSLGFAPPSGSALLNELARQRVSRDELLRLGLVARREDGSLYDRFRGRVIFPIRDRRGRVIAFGGRSLGDDPPKYLNSPETPLFKKGEGLYGLAEARDAIRDAERVVLVEGYMDVLLLVQEAVPYAVAVLGTALTAAQLRLLRPFGGQDVTVYFFFDGDAAGRKAAQRAFGVCAEAEVWGKAVFLPEGHDPDSYVREFGTEAVLMRLEQGVPLAEFYLDSIAPAGSTLPERARAAEQVTPILARVTSDVRFDLLARQAATRLGVGEEVFRRARRAVSAASPAAVKPSTPVLPQASSRAEILLLQMMILKKEAAALVAADEALELFAAPELAQIASDVADVWASGGDMGRVIETASPEIAAELTACLLGKAPLGDADPLQITGDLVVRLRRDAERRQRRPLVAAVRQAESRGDEDRSKIELNRLNDLHRREGGAA